MNIPISFFRGEPPGIPETAVGHFLNRGPFVCMETIRLPTQVTRVTFPPARKEEREAGVIHGTPWVPRVKAGPVCTYTVPRICGPWHGAQLGGPIPLTRSQHPSLAIIPLGGSLTKDLIKYCYTRNLVPLRPLHPHPMHSECNSVSECNSLESA